MLPEKQASGIRRQMSLAAGLSRVTLSEGPASRPRLSLGESRVGEGRVGVESEYIC
jgi:hypothetical protein